MAINGAYFSSTDTLTSLFGVLPLSKGGTGATSAAAARTSTSLNIDQRTTVNNTNYAALSTDRYIGQIGTLTAPITITLPAASSVNPGQVLIIQDESGSVTTTNYINVAPNGTDDLQGANTTRSFRTAYERIDLYSDGVSNWYYDVSGIAEGGTGNTSVPSAGQLLIGTGSNFTLATLTGSTNILVTNGAGSITLALTGTVPVANGGTNNATAYTAGSVIFSNGTSLTQDNTKFFWDDTNFRLGIGTAAPARAIDVTGTGSVRLGAVIGASATPTVTYSTGAGTGPATGALIGTQEGGFFNFTTGTTPAVGLVFTLTFPITAPNYIIGSFFPANAAAAGVLARVFSSSTPTTITLNTSGTALAASTTYAFNFTTTTF